MNKQEGLLAKVPMSWRSLCAQNSCMIRRERGRRQCSLPMLQRRADKALRQVRLAASAYEEGLPGRAARLHTIAERPYVLVLAAIYLPTSPTQKPI